MCWLATEVIAEAFAKVYVYLRVFLSQTIKCYADCGKWTIIYFLNARDRKVNENYFKIKTFF